MQPNIEPVVKSGVFTAWFHWIGSGRSTRTPRLSSRLTRLSSWAFARSTVASGRGPHMPRISLSSGTLASVAGSDGGIQVKSARPTIACFSGSKSFHELTTVASISVSPYAFYSMKFLVEKIPRNRPTPLPAPPELWPGGRATSHTALATGPIPDPHSVQAPHAKASWDPSALLGQ